jgi:hypothetical protein
MREPTSLIQFLSVQKVAGPSLEIRFKNLGPWQTFRLLRASQLNGVYLAVPNLNPVSLGNNEFLFICPMGNGSGHFRVEGQ